MPLDNASTLAALSSVAGRAPRAEQGTTFTLHSDGKGTAVVGRTEISSWAQAVSLITSKPVTSFLMLEGAWSMDVFNAGQHALFLDAHHPQMEPLLGGDVNAAATLFGTSPKVFKRFHKLLVEDESRGELAFPKDAIAAADEWGCTQIAQHLGIANYPEDPDAGGTEFVASNVGVAAEWQGLPERLPLSVCAPEGVPKRLRYGSEEQQREATAWAETWALIAPKLSLSVLEKIESHGAKSAGVATRTRALSVTCHHALNDRQRALQGVEPLLTEWLGPAVPEAANQYLELFEIQRIADMVRPYATPPVLALCDRIRQSEPPDLAMPEGDFF